MFDLWRSLIKALRALIMLPTLIQTTFAPGLRPKSFRGVSRRDEDRKLDNLYREVKRSFEDPLKPRKLLAVSERLQEEYEQSTQSNEFCMLPSFNDTLPSGTEQGTYLSLDVGGSTFRIALVELLGKHSGAEDMKTLKLKSFKIDTETKRLRGAAFFDWMAQKIEQVLTDGSVLAVDSSAPLSTGLAWSFPIDQTSIRTGLVRAMGKGFDGGDSIIGQDLSELLTSACEKRNLNIRIDSILNDSSATLLSRAYHDPSTRFALILGTGMNIAAHLPVAALGRAKFGDRPQSWFDEAKHVLVNTEVSMYGESVFPITRWDMALKRDHPQPNYQPFEQLCSGRYLGEIVRLVVMEAIQDARLFGGEVPLEFSEPYSFDTGTMAVIEADTSAHLTAACAVLQMHHPLSKPPSYRDLLFVRQICRVVSHRAAAYVATGVHGMWCMRNAAEGINPFTSGRTVIGCNGSVIQKYPNFKATCQRYLNDLVRHSGGDQHSVVLVDAVESAIFGAAVAACCADVDRR